MFKIPDWGDDVPKSNIDVKKLFPNKNQPKRKQNQGKAHNNDNLKNIKKIKARPKSAVTGKINKTRNQPKIKNRNQAKYKAKKFINGSPKVSNITKKTEREPTPSHNIDIQYCDTDKLDQVLLDAKKKNLTDSYKKEDNEEELFTENVEKNETSSFVRTPQKSKKIIDNKLSSGKKLKTDKVIKRNLKKQLTQNKIHSNNNIEIVQDEKKNIHKNNAKTKNNRKLLENGLNSNESSTKNNKQKPKTTQNDNTNNNSVNVVDSSIAINGKATKADRKKELFKTILHNHRNPINGNTGHKLRSRMLEKLNAAKFRFLNEKLYTSSGAEAQKLFQEDPAAFQTYHQGYQQQVKKWPVNPLDVVVKRIKNMPKTHLIADLGCGEAALSKRVTQTVRSFDLVATAPSVEVSDMAHTPLLSSSMDVAVYCLALMGTELTQYLVEANRFLKMGGHLLIAEVESRFDDVESFTKEVQKLGFTLRKLDKSHQVFYFMEFTKAREAPVKKSKLPSLYLKPCLYKRR